MTDDATRVSAPQDDDLGIPGLTGAQVIGRGGYGVVYRARQAELNRVVAVKVLSTALDSAGQERFAREGYAMGTVAGHPNVVSLHSVGTTAHGRPYLLMPLLEEGSLAERLPVPVPVAVSFVIKLAGALHTAHAAGVLHRDLKPSNVLISAYGEPQLADFGIARVSGGYETSEGVVSASVPYAPPEIFAGEPPAVASDVYSLAATLFAALAGRPPFGPGAGEELVATVVRISRDPVPDLRPDGVPDPVCTAMEAALAKDPGARPASAETFGRLLQEAEAACGFSRTSMVLAAPIAAAATPAPAVAVTATAPTQVLGPGAATRRRRPAVLAGVVLAGGAAAVAALLLTQGGSDPGATAPDPPRTTSSPAATPADSSGPSTATAAFTPAVPFTAPLGLGIAVDGAVYVADNKDHRIQRVGPQAAVVAGNGRTGSIGVGVGATQTPVPFPAAVVAAPDGSLYIGGDGYVRHVDTEGILRPVPGYDEKGRYYGVVDLSFGAEGLWVAETDQVRLVNSDGTVVAVPGGFGRIEAMTADPAGGAVVADGNRVYRLRADGTREVIAGTADPNTSPEDGRKATDTRLATPTGLAFDPAGRLHIAELDAARIRRMEADGTLRTVVGSPDGSSGNGDSGDGGPARAATFGHIVAIAFDRAGQLYLVDELNHRVRRVAPDGQRVIRAYS